MAAPAAAESQRREKAIATLRAQFALAGVELVVMADGSFVASRWGLVKPLADVAAAEAFLQLVRGQKA
jgi:hypothetical protein